MEGECLREVLELLRGEGELERATSRALWDLLLLGDLERDRDRDPLPLEVALAICFLFLFLLFNKKLLCFRCAKNAKPARQCVV